MPGNKMGGQTYTQFGTLQAHIKIHSRERESHKQSLLSDWNL